MPETTYGSTSLLEAGCMAETDRTGEALSEAGAETVVNGVHAAGGWRTHRLRSPAVVAEEGSNAGSV